MKPWLKILIGLVLGVVTGLILNRQVEFLSLVGKAFIDLLKMLVGLIVFSSLVTGMCHINDPKKLGRIGARTLIFYGVTTLIAIGFGLVMVYAIQPGKNLNLTLADGMGSGGNLSLIDFIFSIVPSNPFASFAEGNVLQIIVFAIFFAFAITLAKEKAKPILHFIESISEVMANLTHVVMRFAPYGVFALMATAVGAVGSKIILPLFWAVVCIFCACVLHVVIVFAGSLKGLAKVDIAPFFKGMKDAIIVAFTTSSSSATLPVSLECARDHLGLSPDISGFVLSLGSTINMNGTAIGQAVLSIFIAQAYGIEITPISILILIFTTLISAVGTAGIPGSGLVMLSIVLNAMGLPLEGIGIVAAIDRFRDMFGTVVNILGDAVAAVYVAKKEGQIDEKKYHTVTWIS
ncbi:dicarboxylate/amino acid:cation symporter [Simkania negevensis]|uniref:Proton/sodium-glutamate symport protein n=1 Tax=Simkania negevensis (strain ATCC VR-1471 / DSM 27360 / Z) TaxID=331113 RepID=F8L6B1_SIMNZ|nr:dicarboxylate/amino acid:cation symporter [Simkania negevensis]MCB1067575.1 dicarboxylate/amino acid:cation symporter [Simkania sp.]CCB88241.1 proton/sodium-glutamate symport protein [Simkania negevensis Z]